MIMRLAACLVLMGCAAAICVSPARSATCEIAKGETTSLGEPATRYYARQRLQQEVQALKGRFESSGLKVRIKKLPMKCRVWLNLGAIGTEYICTATAEVCGR